MAVFDSEDKVLLTRRSENIGIFPNAWVLPGGHVENGETLEEAVIREI
jgi:8-oxo-dGTP diphosphatase